MNQDTTAAGSHESPLTGDAKSPPAAPPNPANRTSPPVLPKELESDYEQGVLFSDPELTAWWWNTHDFMSVSERLEMCIKAERLCTSRSCKVMLQQVRDELEQFAAPVSTWDSVGTNLRGLVQDRPYFTVAIAISIVWLLISAGGSLYSLITRIAAS